jgi:hypothetical protein
MPFIVVIQTDEVLSEFGLTADEIGTLKLEKVV